MHLRQIAAAGVKLFPDIGRCIQADDVHALIAQVEHVVRHVIEDRRIRIVQIPLIGIERGHDDLAGLLTPGEIARRSRGEHLRHRLLVDVRDRPIVIEEVALLILDFARARAPSPFVVLACVVHHEIETDRHALLVAFVRKPCQVLHRPQLRLNLSEIRHGIAAVASVLRAFQQGHQVQIIDARLLQVIQMLLYTPERAAEALGIHEHAQHIALLEPVRLFKPLCIQSAELHLSFFIAAAQHAHEIRVSMLVVIQRQVQPLYFFAHAGHSRFKNSVHCCSPHRQMYVISQKILTLYISIVKGIIPSCRRSRAFLCPRASPCCRASPGRRG